MTHAVEQQGGATQEIAKSAQGMSQSTQSTANIIEIVRNAASDFGASADSSQMPRKRCSSNPASCAAKCKAS